MLSTLFSSNLSRREPDRRIAWLLILAVGLLGLAVILGGCSKGDVVAKVGSKSITATQFKDEMVKRYRTLDFASQRSLEERKEVLKSMIDQQRKLQDAYRLGLDDDSLTQKMANDTREQAAIQELYKVEILDKVIPQAEIKVFYDKMGEEIKASHILLKLPMDAPDSVATPVKVRADSIYNVLLKGDVDFADLAKKVSEDMTTAQNGGDLGFFGWGRMVDEFQETAFKMKSGELGKPVKTSYGYHIIKVMERRPNPNRKSFAEEQENISQQLRRKYQTQLNQAAQAYLDTLKSQHQLKYNYANIQKILDKVNDPAAPQNNSMFAGFTAEEKKWEVVTMTGQTLTVADLEREAAKMGGMQQSWRDQKAVISAVERLVIPKFLGERAKEIKLYSAKSVADAYTNTLESRMIQMVESNQVENRINASDSVLMGYYQNHLNEFMTDSTVMVQEIYIMTDAAKGRDEAFTRQIAGRAQKGENFLALVKKYTDRKSSIENDGKIGPLTSRQYGEMGKAAFKLEVGQISDPIPMGARAYSIIKVLEKTHPRQKTYEEAKPLVERQIRVQQGDSLRTAWLADMEKRYSIMINDQVLVSAFPMKPEATDMGKTPPPQGNPMRSMPQTPPGTPNPHQAAPPQGGK
jgi:parvulin-like peptidyl-prolyl isomerase